MSGENKHSGPSIPSMKGLSEACGDLGIDFENLQNARTQAWQRDVDAKLAAFTPEERAEIANFSNEQLQFLFFGK